MPTIEEIRQKYPQYGDMSDTALGDALHDKFYKDMPRDQFNEKIGLAASATGAKMSLSDVGISAIKNVPSSAVEFGKNVAQPFIHPIQTAESLGNLGMGVMEKLGVKSGTEHQQYADAFGKFLVDRYGSVEAVKNTIATDPVGVAADLSMFLTGGETALARVPATAGKVAETVGAVGRAADPLRAVGSAVKLAGKGAASVVGELGTHTGGRSIREAAEAGFEGGEAGKAFQENLRGTEPIANVVQDARQALGKMRQERGAAYVEAMKDVAADKTVLDFDKIDKALANISQVKTYKGEVISQGTQEIRQDIAQKIAHWKTLDPKEFHTPEGLDALKQQIGDVRDNTEFNTPQRVVADQAYHAVRQTIVDEFPGYAKIMKGYEEASTLVKEIEQTLAGKPNTNIDTSLRKLQSVLRNNVNTNYGRREELAEYLVNAGAPNLTKKLAGQALSPVFPRGLGKMVGTEMLAAGAGALGAGATGAGAAVLGLAPFMSPRLMGEAAYYTGKAASKVPEGTAAAGQAAFQGGRAALEAGPLYPGSE